MSKHLTSNFKEEPCVIVFIKMYFYMKGESNNMFSHKIIMDIKYDIISKPKYFLICDVFSKTLFWRCKGLNKHFSIHKEVTNHTINSSQNNGSKSSETQFLNLNNI